MSSFSATHPGSGGTGGTGSSPSASGASPARLPLDGNYDDHFYTSAVNSLAAELNAISGSGHANNMVAGLVIGVLFRHQNKDRPDALKYIIIDRICNWTGLTRLNASKIGYLSQKIYQNGRNSAYVTILGPWFDRLNGANMFLAEAQKVLASWRQSFPAKFSFYQVQSKVAAIEKDLPGSGQTSPLKASTTPLLPPHLGVSNVVGSTSSGSNPSSRSTSKVRAHPYRRPSGASDEASDLQHIRVTAPRIAPLDTDDMDDTERAASLLLLSRRRTSIATTSSTLATAPILSRISTTVSSAPPVPYQPSAKSGPYVTPAQTHSNLPSPDQLYASTGGQYPSMSHGGTNIPVPKFQSPILDVLHRHHSTQMGQQKPPYFPPPPFSDHPSPNHSGPSSSSLVFPGSGTRSTTVQESEKRTEGEAKEGEGGDEKKDVMSINSLLC